MFWSLLLAHFIADFPLQHNWIARNKHKFAVLTLHVAIHLGVMLLVAGEARTSVWPYLLLLALFHFGIDHGKNEIQRLKPKWVIMPYIIDQLFHYLLIALVALMIGRSLPEIVLTISRTASIYLTGYLVATYVWFITERIFFFANTHYHQEVLAQFWPRMAVRALLLSVFLWGTSFIPIVVIVSGPVTSLPYISGKHARRAFLTDISVALVVMILIRLVTWDFQV